MLTVPSPSRLCDSRHLLTYLFVGLLTGLRKVKADFAEIFREG